MKGRFCGPREALTETSFLHKMLSDLLRVPSPFLFLFVVVIPLKYFPALLHTEQRTNKGSHDVSRTLSDNANDLCLLGARMLSQVYVCLPY